MPRLAMQVWLGNGSWIPAFAGMTGGEAAIRLPLGTAVVRTAWAPACAGETGVVPGCDGSGDRGDGLGVLDFQRSWGRRQLR